MRDLLSMYCALLGFVQMYCIILVHRHCTRADRSGAFDVLQDLSVSPEGAKDLQRAEFWAGNAPNNFIVTPAWVAALELFGASSEWQSETVRYIVVVTYAVAWPFGLAQAYTSVGANLACCAIVRDQLRQFTRRLDGFVSSSVAAHTEPAFDFRATMVEIYRLAQQQVQCERIGANLLLTVLCFHLATGAIFAYGLATNDPNALALNLLLGIFGVVFFAQCIDLLLGPMSVTTGAHGQPPHSFRDSL